VNRSTTTDQTPVWRATAAEEERLVRHLSETARVRFTGEGDDHRIITGTTPSKVLQLGILPALPQPNPAEQMSPEQLAQRIGQAPSTMGLDFRLDRQGGIGVLDVVGCFSFYVPRYPTRDEQAAFYSDERSHSRSRREDEGFADGDDASTRAETDSSSGTMKLMAKYERFDIETSSRVTVDGERGEQVLDLSADVLAQLEGALTAPETVYPFLGRRGQTLDVAALNGDEASFMAAVAIAEGNARDAPHAGPAVSLTVAWQPDGEGTVRIQVTLGNETIEPQLAGRGGRSRSQQGGPRVLPREQALFNCRLEVSALQGTVRPLRFHQAPADFRYADIRHTWALGRSCVARRDGDNGPLLTDTWPEYRQSRTVPTRGHQGELELGFAELADEGSMMVALDRVTAGMKAFDTRWQEHLDAWCGDEESRQACETARREWQAEMGAFERGIGCLRADAELRRSFSAANEVFAKVGARRGYESWRLFQVAFIVTQMSALRARRDDDERLRADLDICDVLWASTGAGKTEGYLGLIVTAMFYDRYRGKQRGSTALLRYPLRMLSVQQLQRIAVAVTAAEQVRRQLLADGEQLDGDPFELGYWAGFSNTPNRLSDDRSGGETAIEWWENQLKVNPEAGQSRRIITICPYEGCDGDLELHADVAAVRLRHVCRTCGREAPIHMTDEEVYRACPAVVVCTVDKLARVAWAEEFVNLLSGPAYRCPDHGYFTWHRGGRDLDNRGAPKKTDRCAVGERCGRAAAEYRVVARTTDPAPALIIQDELHLLEEELGTFDSHYETLMDVMWEELGEGLRPKLLAATATIEGGEAQVVNLYARHIREFPTQGYDRHTSFYQSTDQTEARRIYVGALPNRPDVMEFGALAQGVCAAEIGRLQADPDAALAMLGYADRDRAWMSGLLERYELSLGYINRKDHAPRIQQVLRSIHHRPTEDTLHMPFELPVEVLVAGAAGESSLADIASVLDRVESQYDDGTPPEERLRAIIATSLISHGVDLDSLNVLVMNRMTPTVAGYVQASSRAGRKHTGLVIVGFDRRIVRERSFYGHFLDYHAYIDRLIAPVPVNRFARFAPKVTMPGLVSALVLHVLSRRNLDAEGLDPQRPMVPLFKRFALRRWWTGPNGTGAREGLRPLVMRALGLGATRLRRDGDGRIHGPEPLFGRVYEDWLEEEAGHEFTRQIDQLENWQSRESLAQKLIPRPLTSFRSVDDPIEFRCIAAATDVQGDLTDPRSRPAGRRRRRRASTSSTTDGSN
jgi:hypothetical protein